MVKKSQYCSWCCKCLAIPTTQSVFFACSDAIGMVLITFWAWYGRFTHPPTPVGKGGAVDRKLEEPGPSRHTSFLIHLPTSPKVLGDWKPSRVPCVVLRSPPRASDKNRLRGVDPQLASTQTNRCLSSIMQAEKSGGLN